MPGPDNDDRSRVSRVYQEALAGHRAAIDALGDDHLDALANLATAVREAWAAGG
ncbi:hypothetical protein H8E07_08340, partial [bacterium]|nr:hypothetical protein [bacterium]